MIYIDTEKGRNHQLFQPPHRSPSRNQQVSFDNPWSTSSHCVSPPIAFSTIPTNTHTHTHSWWARGCIHLPLSHHNTLFKLDTARRLFFLAEFIEPVQPYLPYQSVKGIFHSLQYETQRSSMLRNTGGHTVYGCMCYSLQIQKGVKQTSGFEVGQPTTSDRPLYLHKKWYSTQNLSREYRTLTSCRPEKVCGFLSLNEEGLWLD